MNEWTAGVLSDVLEEVNERNVDRGARLVLSVTEGRGIVPQTEIFKKRIAIEDTSKYKLLRPLDIAWNPYLLWTGAIGQWLGTEFGITSPVYPVYRTRQGQSARFWGLVLECGWLTSYFNSRAIGSIQRRRRTTPADFKAAPIEIPPLRTQQRIVETIGAIDDQIAALDVEGASVRRVMFATALHLLSLPGSEAGVTIDSLLRQSLGGVWGEEPGTGQKDVSVYRSTEFTNDGVLVTPAEAVRSVSSKQASSRRLVAGDILLEKSGGTPTRPTGRVVRVRDVEADAIYANFLHLLRADEGLVEPGYLFWVLWTAHRRGDPFAFQSATTNIRNLKTPAYLARRLELPSRENQAECVAALDALQAVALRTDAEVDRLRSTRTALLSCLLNRKIELDDVEDEVA